MQNDSYARASLHSFDKVVMSYNKIVIYTENSYCEQERLYRYI